MASHNPWSAMKFFPESAGLFPIFEVVLLLYIHSPDSVTVQAMNLRAEHEIVSNSLDEHYRKMSII